MCTKRSCSRSAGLQVCVIQGSPGTRGFPAGWDSQDVNLQARYPARECDSFGGTAQSPHSQLPPLQGQDEVIKICSLPLSAGRCFLGLPASGCVREGWLMTNRRKDPAQPPPPQAAPPPCCAGFETHDLALNFPSSLSKPHIYPCPAGQAAAEPVPKAVGNVFFVPALWAGSSSPAAQYSPQLWPRK